MHECTLYGLQVAVLGFYVTPATNGIGASIDGLQLHHWLALHLSEYALLPLRAAFLLTYPLAMLLATYFDATTLYVDGVAAPAWACPRPHDEYSLVNELLVATRLRTGVMRIFHVVVGHVPYTRAQLTHVLATSIAVNALLVGLFLGREQAHIPSTELTWLGLARLG
jgi:hypothetical protein